MKKRLTLLLMLLTLSAEIFTQVYSILPQQWGNIVLLSNLTIPGLVSPDRASPYLQAVAAYYRGDYTAAVYSFRTLSLRDESLSRHWIASSLAALEEWRQAIDLLNPKYPHDQELIASILLSRLPSMAENERSHWEQFMRSSVPGIALQYAAILLANGEYEKSDQWARVVPDYDRSREALLISGQSYFYRSGHMETAIQIFNDAYQRFPNPATAYWLGRALSYTGQVSTAIPLLEEAAAASGREVAGSTLAWYILELANAYAKTDNCEDIMLTIMRFDELATKTRLSSGLLVGRDQIWSKCVK